MNHTLETIEVRRRTKKGDLIVWSSAEKKYVGAWHSDWVFDEPRFNLLNEPFINGANDTLDDLDEKHQANGKLRLQLSDQPMKDYDVQLKSISKREYFRTHGCSYHDGKRELWLFPSTMQYFSGECAPETIYWKVLPAD